MPYSVSVKEYEGPLDVLLRLIERAEIDIRDIFISEITSQFIDYVNEMDIKDPDLASEFITMAARLLYIKSRSLLPKPPKEQDEEQDDTDPELELIRQLQEYKAFKDASAYMQGLFEDAVHSRTKLAEEFVLPEQETVFKGGTALDLYEAFSRVLARLDKEEAEHIDSQQVNADVYTVRDCMKTVRDALFDTDIVEFDKLFESKRVKMEVIVTFMALLEMIMRGEVRLRQEAPYEPIWIVKNVLAENDESASYMDEEE